jgi:hypothetical protein
MAMFTSASPVFPVDQSEAGRGLAPFTVRMVSPTEMALAGLGAEDLQAEVVVAVALAQLRAALEAGDDALRRGLRVGGEEGVAATAQVDRVGGGLHDDDLAGVDGAAQSRSGLQLNSHRSPSISLLSINWSP